ncbi:hypothetical protein ABE438_17645 [Bosea sp. TWI1241]|uniref:hypothetical protein n=1 Tax=Bosea sp. TWI1241 TaxID=3148904 RepID=UPI0032096759
MTVLLTLCLAAVGAFAGTVLIGAGAAAMFGEEEAGGRRLALAGEALIAGAVALAFFAGRHSL